MNLFNFISENVHMSGRKSYNVIIMLSEYFLTEIQDSSQRRLKSVKMIKSNLFLVFGLGNAMNKILILPK